MGHMLAFGALLWLSGVAVAMNEPLGSERREFGKGLIFSGVVALIWAGAVLIVRLVP